MKIGALAATAANVLLLTFFIFQSFQSPFGRKGQDGALVDMQRQAMMAAEEHFKLGSPSAESHFKPWIKKDLSTWAQQGIAIVSSHLFDMDFLKGGQPGRQQQHCCLPLSNSIYSASSSS